MKKLFVVLFCALMMSAPSFADEVSYEIDPAATAKAPWKVEQTIIEKGYCLEGNFYRKFLGITQSGLALVQDFYLSGEKFTSPFQVSVEYAGEPCSREHTDGVYIRWFKNGQKFVEGNIKNGEFEGILMGWYESGKKQAELNFQNGKLEGTKTNWYENGQKKVEANYKNDKLEGVKTEWYESGQKYWECNYKNDKAEGLMTTWYENGQKKYEGHLKNYNEVGIWREWDEKGNLIEEKDYGTPTD